MFPVPHAPMWSFGKRRLRTATAVNEWQASRFAERQPGVWVRIDAFKIVRRFDDDRPPAGITTMSPGGATPILGGRHHEYRFAQQAI